MVIYRGEIWWVNLATPIGSEPGYKRPVIIVQDDSYNHSQINTVLAIVISSNLALTLAPSNVFLSKAKT